MKICMKIVAWDIIDDLPAPNPDELMQLLSNAELKKKNKAGYTATLVAWGWAGAVLEKVTRASGQEPYAQKAQKRQKSNKSSKNRTWSAVPDALLGVIS